MRFPAIMAAAVCCGLMVSAPQLEAKPGGCLKYGAAGAVAGHYAGHHAGKGFVAGCIAGIARRRAYNNEQKRLKEQQEQQKQLPPPQTQGEPSKGM
jgi:hypothetical protein